VVLRGVGPIGLYLDFKEINHLARRLYGLSDWHWLMVQKSTSEIESFTRHAISALSRSLKNQQAHGQAFIAVRHPRVAEISREIDPAIRIMASPDRITATSSTEAVLKDFETFAPYHPEFIELKYLKHGLDPSIRDWAHRKGIKILYNQILQTDPSQFEGKYADRLGVLIHDLMTLGTDILIQTNTPREVQGILGKSH
jgi:hypothetical protein